MITNQERKERKEAVMNALANARLEGYEIIEEDLVLWERYIDGEISLEEAGRTWIDKSRSTVMPPKE